MKKYLCNLLLIVPFLGFGQEENLKPTIIDNTDPTRWIYISPQEPPGLRGDRYLFDQWQLAKITFKGKVVKEGLLVNYNLEDEELEISTTEGIKIVPPGFISSWEAGDRVFVSLYGSQDECIRSAKAYGEVLTESGDLILLKVQHLEKRNPVYNEKLGIGDNNYRYTRSDQILLLNNAKCLDISGSASRREKNMIHFLKNQKISEMVHEQKLDLKQEADLIILVSLVAQNM